MTTSVMEVFSVLLEHDNFICIGDSHVTSKSVSLRHRLCFVVYHDFVARMKFVDCDHLRLEKIESLFVLSSLHSPSPHHLRHWIHHHLNCLIRSNHCLSHQKLQSITSLRLSANLCRLIHQLIYLYASPPVNTIRPPPPPTTTHLRRNLCLANIGKLLQKDS
eukprot:scaffold39142_cov42-Cyclotella_meneghiniana.AAC.1